MPYLGIHAVSDKILIVGNQISRILVRGLQPCQNLLGNLFVIPVVSLISDRGLHQFYQYSWHAMLNPISLALHQKIVAIFVFGAVCKVEINLC